MERREIYMYHGNRAVAMFFEEGVARHGQLG
jgi:hypothetical protein